jgi:VIT1/CCC1 family predicted Fe2+/Mn2+ transporter
MEVFLYMAVTLAFVGALAFGSYIGWRQGRPALLWSCTALLAIMLLSYVLPFIMS